MEEITVTKRDETFSNRAWCDICDEEKDIKKIKVGIFVFHLCQKCVKELIEKLKG